MAGKISSPGVGAGKAVKSLGKAQVGKDVEKGEKGTGKGSGKAFVAGFARGSKT